MTCSNAQVPGIGLNRYTPPVNKEIDDAGDKAAAVKQLSGDRQDGHRLGCLQGGARGEQSLTFRYRRGAATTNTGMVIPAENFDLPLVK